MFSDFAKIFSRDFVLGYFLPSLLFIIVFTFVYITFYNTESNIITDLLKLKDWAIPSALFSCWFLGVLLMIANYHLVRILEGYPFLQFNYLTKRQQHKFDDLCIKLINLREKYELELQNNQLTPDTGLEYQNIFLQRRSYYPEKREDVLPTKFGNVMRAFETYSLFMYGMDAIPLWPRLSTIFPESHGEALSAARSMVDHAINIIYLSIAIIIEYVTLVILTGRLPTPWFVLLSLLSIWIAYRMLITNAIQWGDLVKASFDLYRYDLLKQMGLERPKDWEQERILWLTISQSFLYWYPIDAPRASHKEASATSRVSAVASPN